MKRTIRNLALSLALVGGTLWGVAAPSAEAQSDCFFIRVCYYFGGAHYCDWVLVCI